MSTRTGSRIYRGVPRAVEPGNCPGCNEPISINLDHRRRQHKGRDGRLCSFSGTRVEAAEPFVLAELPPIRMPRAKVVHGTSLGRIEALPAHCAECGRHMPHNRDGSRRKHRIEADNPIAAWCPGDDD